MIHRSCKEVCNLFNGIGLYGKHDGELLGKVIVGGVHENLPARLPELPGMRQPMGLLHDVIGFEELYSFAKLNVHAPVAQICAAQISSANGAVCNRVVAEGSVLQVLGGIILEGGSNLLDQKMSCTLGVVKREVAGLLMERFFRKWFQRGKWDSQPLTGGQLLQKSSALSNICSRIIRLLLTLIHDLKPVRSRMVWKSWLVLVSMMSSIKAVQNLALKLFMYLKITS